MIRQRLQYTVAMIEHRAMFSPYIFSFTVARKKIGLLIILMRFVLSFLHISKKYTKLPISSGGRLFFFYSALVVLRILSML